MDAETPRMTTTPLTALRQHSTGALRPGEEFVAGLHVHAPNHDRASRDAMFGVVVGSIMAYRDQQREQAASTIAVPAAGAYVAVTGQRVLVFASSVSMHPTELLGAVDRENLRLDVETGRVGLVKQTHLRLLHGGETVLDAACSAKSPDLDTIRDLIPPPEPEAA